jgi:hypothetical protein
MRQTVNAPLQAQMQQTTNAGYAGFSVNKPANAAKLLRNDWDDTILYKFKIGVLMLNEYLQPLGTAFEYIHNGDIVNMRKLCATLAKTEPAFIYIAINSPAAVYKDFLTLDKEHASLLYKFALAITNLDIDVQGYLLLDPFDHVAFSDDVALLNYKG